VANQDDAQATWLPVIGKALAYLCLQEALRKDPKKYDTVLKQVKFLQALGLSRRCRARGGELACIGAGDAQ
jgi:hypothetical protein